MKTFRIAFAALAFLAMSMPIRANIIPTATSTVNLCTQAVEAKKVVIQITNMEQQPTFLILQSTDGAVYYRESIRGHNGHRALLDLERLPEGKYILNVRRKGEKEAVSQVIRIMEGRVLVSQCEGQQ